MTAASTTHRRRKCDTGRPHTVDTAGRHWTPRWLALAAITVCSAASYGAAAEPSVWQAARSKKTYAEAETLRAASTALGDYYTLDKSTAGASRVRALDHLRVILERDNGAQSQNVLLRFHLATVYNLLLAQAHVSPRTKLVWLKQARDHLRFVTDHPLTNRTLRREALSDLAIVYAKLGAHHVEIDTYTRALTLEPHAESRAVLLANRAESFMAEGDILRAVRGYRESLQAAPSAATFRLHVTTFWGLAVALDRSGNLDGALQRIVDARRYDPADQAINGPNWFYVPAYDHHWYKALGHWSKARSMRGKEARADALDSAITRWSQYIQRAPATDHWRALARRRLHQCQRERARVLTRR